MNITVPVSVGEVIDKVTILEIKSERISDEAKLKKVLVALCAESAVSNDTRAALAARL